jgi:hypothetical protein
VHISYCSLHRSLSISILGLDEQSIENTAQAILNRLEKQNVSNFLQLSEDQLSVLTSMKDKLSQLKSENGLNNISIVPEEHKIVFTGKASNAARVKEEIKQLLSNIYTETVTFSKQDQVSVGDAHRLKDELMLKYQVSIKINADQNNGNIVVLIRSVNQEACKEVASRFSGLKMIQQIFDYPPDQYKQLASIVLGKDKFNMNEFKQEWDLSYVYLDNNTNQVKITARNAEDCLGAKQALDALLKDTKIVSATITLPDATYLKLLRSPKCPLLQKYNAIEKENNVKFNTPKDKQDVIHVRGPKSNVQVAKQKLEQLLKELNGIISSISIDIPSAEASELIKDGWKLAKQFSNETGVYIHFPERDKSKVVATLTGQGFKIDVVQV